MSANPGDPTAPFTKYKTAENLWDINGKTGVALYLRWEVEYAHISEGQTPKKTDAFTLFDRWVNLVRGVASIAWCLETKGGAFVAGAPTLNDHTPTSSVDGQPINYARLGVVHKFWYPGNASQGGGFIRQATGWTPSPFQPSVSVDFLRVCARNRRRTS